MNMILHFCRAAHIARFLFQYSKIDDSRLLTQFPHSAAGQRSSKRGRDGAEWWVLRVHDEVRGAELAGGIGCRRSAIGVRLSA